MPSTLDLRKKARERRQLLAIVDEDGDPVEVYETGDPDVVAVIRADGSVAFYAFDPDAVDSDDEPQHDDDEDDDEDEDEDDEDE
jgi:hypothetical protein